MRRSFKSGSHENEGQTLIQVALSMVVLLAFVGLAINVGQAYSERRRMQNAADAGALAGAWELCFGVPENALTKAETYAIDNLAETASASYYEGHEWQIYVEARKPVEPFVSFVLEMINFSSLEVKAHAVAACGTPRNLCDVWPITFNQFRFQEIPCGQPFYVWNDDSLEDSDLDVKLADGTLTTMPVCELCNCDVAFGAPDGNTYLISTSNRGWVTFPTPVPPYSADPACTNNCGANQLKCIVNGGYNAPIDIPPGGICLPGKSGVNESVRIEVGNNLNREANLLLWDRACSEGEPITGTCSTTAYHVTGTGCFVALGIPTIDLPKKAEYMDVQILSSGGWLRNNEMCARQVKTILAEKRCICESTCGSTTGDECLTGQVCSVSLIQ